MAWRFRPDGAHATASLTRSASLVLFFRSLQQLVRFVRTNDLDQFSVRAQPQHFSNQWRMGATGTTTGVAVSLVGIHRSAATRTVLVQPPASAVGMSGWHQFGLQLQPMLKTPPYRGLKTNPVTARRGVLPIVWFERANDTLHLIQRPVLVTPLTPRPESVPRGAGFQENLALP